MTNRLVLESELLRYIASWSRDPNSPDHEVPILFPDTLNDLPTLKGALDQDQDFAWRQLEAILSECHVREWLHVTWITDTSCYARLTEKGYERLEYHEQNRIVRRLWRGAGKLADRAFWSVFAPVIVTILTVLALKWIGLAD